MRRTLNVRQMQREARRHELDGVVDTVPAHWRPRTRADCTRPDSPRPCPYVACRFHLAADVGDKGSIVFNARMDGSIDAGVLANMTETCALDVAEQGAHTLDEVGSLLGMTRERVRQIEAEAHINLRHALRGVAEVGMAELSDFDKELFRDGTQPPATPAPNGKRRRKRPAGDYEALMAEAERDDPPDPKITGHWRDLAVALLDAMAMDDVLTMALSVEGCRVEVTRREVITL